MVIVHIVSGKHGGEDGTRTEHAKFFDANAAENHATRLRASRGWTEVQVDAKLEHDDAQHEAHAGLGLVPVAVDLPALLRAGGVPSDLLRVDKTAHEGEMAAALKCEMHLAEGCVVCFPGLALPPVPASEAKASPLSSHTASASLNPHPLDELVAPDPLEHERPTKEP